ncbi:hypothetical protein MWN33_07845 [Starkeya koreensis]|uniref:DUF2188 domain-containing protein n=1 Tax=Ancylobacter koreensis TaxID=266121 RepID=A0ABT0DKY1_9HYPH|nr:hypothetical protein [Ancylobacter koreensis]MCK0207945.1 hypothetical protein [Ancylobacter koreensis]
MHTEHAARSLSYRLTGREGEWRVETDELAGMAYASKEAAFEAAVAAASNAIRDGFEVIIAVPGADAEPMLGTEDTGRGAGGDAPRPPR